MAQEVTIDCSQWPSGLYFYKLQFKDKVVMSGKIVKQ